MHAPYRVTRYVYFKHSAEGSQKGDILEGVHYNIINKTSGSGVKDPHYVGIPIALIHSSKLS